MSVGDLVRSLRDENLESGATCHCHCFGTRGPKVLMTMGLCPSQRVWHSKLNLWDYGFLPCQISMLRWLTASVSAAVCSASLYGWLLAPQFSLSGTSLGVFVLSLWAVSFGGL